MIWRWCANSFDSLSCVISGFHLSHSLGQQWGTAVLCPPPCRTINLPMVFLLAIRLINDLWNYISRNGFRALPSVLHISVYLSVAQPWAVATDQIKAFNLCKFITSADYKMLSVERPNYGGRALFWGCNSMEILQFYPRLSPTSTFPRPVLQLDISFICLF